MNINNLIHSALNTPVRHISPLGGGSISAAYKVSLADGRTVFAKIQPQFPDMFQKEANGLRELAIGKTIRIPEVWFADASLLILEYLPVAGMQNRNLFFEQFGRSFARLHRHTSPLFGFGEDNYIGSTPQKNLPRTDSWREFYWSHRLLYQFRLAEQNGYADETLRSLFLKLERHLADIIPDDREPPALLHGDLWGGNYLCLEHDEPAIIDPAVYYGHREADLGMTLLFGGFSDYFYGAYNEEYPLHNGWEQRMEIYKLYHLMNHLNLFGEGYYGQVMNVMRGMVIGY
ncbi:MAG: fructosamine kinase family protein [Bacteroidota bacterium]